MKYKHLIETKADTFESPEIRAAYLDTKSEEGWELLQVVREDNKYVYFFKRPIAERQILKD